MNKKIRNILIITSSVVLIILLGNVGINILSENAQPEEGSERTNGRSRIRELIHQPEGEIGAPIDMDNISFMSKEQVLSQDSFAVNDHEIGENQFRGRIVDYGIRELLVEIIEINENDENRVGGIGDRVAVIFGTLHIDKSEFVGYEIIVGHNGFLNIPQQVTVNNPTGTEWVEWSDSNVRHQNNWGRFQNYPRVNTISARIVRDN